MVSISLKKANGVRTISYILCKIISEVNAACLDFRGFPDLCILIQLCSLEWERGGDRIHRKEDIETISKIFLKIVSKTLCPIFCSKIARCTYLPINGIEHTKAGQSAL